MTETVPIIGLTFSLSPLEIPEVSVRTRGVLDPCPRTPIEAEIREIVREERTGATNGDDDNDDDDGPRCDAKPDFNDANGQSAVSAYTRSY